ncbi:hypothetical protein, partial [Sulfitobacter sp. M220]|uniref:hypothetical protein n=1 Tax=Sulfitobacter sp. M220 TaxID=2675333 RepID=UPI001F20B06A
AELLEGAWITETSPFFGGTVHLDDGTQFGVTVETDSLDVGNLKICSYQDNSRHFLAVRHLVTTPKLSCVEGPI